MRVVNAMFGCGLGGIEQAFVDYANALLLSGHEVLAFYDPEAQVAPFIQSLPVTRKTFRNRGFWDVWAVWNVCKELRAFQPDVIIAHGNRAVSLCRKAAKGNIPVVGVCHNYRLKRLLGSSALFAITEDLRRAAIKGGQAESSIHLIPNMVQLPEHFHAGARSWHTPPVIGAMGRFVHKKGFHVFLEALKILKEQGVAYTAILGGEGEEKEHLEQLIRSYGIADRVTLPGWVKDKNTFFSDIDIFCVPSLHEPFGIVLLEAFQRHAPVVSSASEGPREIITSGKDGLLVPVGDAVLLAESLKKMVQDEGMAHRLADSAVETLKERYALPVVAARIDTALKKVCER